MSSKGDFLRTAIQSLSPERFNEAVMIFERNYLLNEVVSVDGAGDGGCDIKLFQNRREQKRCVQITVNKNVKSKLYDDLVKVDRLVSDYKYSSNFDFFCSVCLSDEKINEYKAYAQRSYSIDLNIYDGHRLSQLDCPELEDYLYSLVKPDSSVFTLDKATKVLYQMLASGKDTSGIKKCILNSIIVSIMFDRGSLSIKELGEEVFSKAKIKVPNIVDTVQELSYDGRAIYDQVSGTVSLSESEKKSIKDIIATSGLIEEEFLTQFNDILKRFGVYKPSLSDSILEDVKKLYKNFYKSDVDGVIDVSQKELIDNFKSHLKKRCQDATVTDELYDAIKELCDNNSYLNRITASESFLSLYKSNKLERYINHKKKILFFDTPAIVYLLLSKFSDCVISDWVDIDYSSMSSLLNICDQNKDRIEIRVYWDYLHEVAWEVKKALQLSWLDECPFTEYLGETSNSFYNYYHYMRENDLFEINEKIDSLSDFIYSLGFDNLDANSPYFVADTVKDLKNILQDYGVEIIEEERFDTFVQCKTVYEKQLMLKNKSKTQHAISNDVSQMLYLLTDNAYINDEDLFFSTWDTTLFDLRDELIRNDDNQDFHFFNICNPAKLSNRIALELFNIDQSAITNDVFQYADKEYDLSKKIKSLRDLISPILGNKDNVNSKVIRCLNTIKKEQLQSSDKMVYQDKRKIYPIEDILLIMMKDGTQNKDYLQKFISFVNNETNSDYFIKVVEDSLSTNLRDGIYDYSDFYSAVETGIIPD